MPTPRVPRSRFRHPLVIALLLAAIATASAGGYNWVRVHPGDTVSAIAARYHTSVRELVALNHLPGNGDLIYAGTRLRVPGHHHAHHAARRAHHSAHHRAHHSAHHRAHHSARQIRGHTRYWVVLHYQVHSGDSLYAIAHRFRVPPKRLIRDNGIPSSLTVRLGEWLKIPHWSKHPDRNGHAAHRSHHAHRAHRVHHRHRTHHHLSPAARLARAVARERVILAGRPEPSQDRAAALIAYTARRFHVPVDFALAISWQESGFNQRVVSPAGAIGLMQVIPSSGRFVSAYVAHRRLHLMHARDNVTAGVGLLSVLMADTHGNERISAAGYYQGLASVRSRGMYRDTKRYVRNVMALRSEF